MKKNILLELIGAIGIGITLLINEPNKNSNLERIVVQQKEVKSNEEKISSEDKLEKEFGVTVEFQERPEYEINFERLQKDFRQIHRPLLKAAKKILIKPIYYSTGENNLFFDEFVAARSDRVLKEVQIKPHRYDISVLGHELTHCFIDEDFFRKWRSVIKINNPDEFFWSNYEEFGLKPRNGFIRSYGAKFEKRNRTGDGVYWLEDPATFIEEIYKPNFGNFKIADESDKRYLEKLGLLREFNLISEQQLKEVTAILGVDFRD